MVKKCLKFSCSSQTAVTLSAHKERELHDGFDANTIKLIILPRTRRTEYVQDPQEYTKYETVFRCSCVDKAHIAVGPADLPQAVDQQPIMSSDHLSSVSPSLDCQPNAGDYRLMTIIGRGFHDLAKIYVALHKPTSTFIVVKQTDVDIKSAEQLETLKHEVQVLRSLSHPNILPLYSTFITRQELWTLFPLMSYGSCTDILKGSFPEGMPELLIANILREVLQGLDYLHRMSIIHRGVKGGHVLIGSDGTVCLSGLRKSIHLYPNRESCRVAYDFSLHAVDLLPWMAPEILRQDLQGYNCSADVYSVGILAIELAHGSVPYTGLPPTKVLLEKLSESSPRLSDTRPLPDDMCTLHTTDTGSMITSLDTRDSSTSDGQKKFSLAFHQLVDICVQQDPSLRPTVSALLGHSFFKQVKKKARDVLPELLSDVPLLTHRKEDKNLDQDLDTLLTGDSLAAMSIDQWVF